AAAPALSTGPIQQKQAEAQQVYNDIQSLNASLSAADEKIRYANLQLQQVEYQQKVNRRELVVAKANLAQSQKMIVDRLLSLYGSPQSSTLDVILGATSLGNLITRIDNSNRLSVLDSTVVREVVQFKSSVQRHARQLVRDHSYANRLLAERQAASNDISSQLAERQRLLSQIKGEISTLQAQEAARRLQAVQAAQAQVAAAQAAQVQAAQATVVGAVASTPEGATVVPSSSVGSQVVSIAMSYLGVPYVWGGATPSGFDCSGLVMYSFAQLGISLPHSSYAQWNYGTPVPYDQLQPGDIVFFDSLGHVGLYIGGGEFVNAPYTGAVVRVDSLSSGWALSHYSGARRIT
ncbi:MAG TPA: NlpC/P60 family protein, partial [Gaiellaceae bacterium]|nr:NlpC/P60 family protein [Gaiellaceae bacterium]